MSEAPPARPSGSEGDVRDPGKTGLTHGAEPTLTATSSMRQEGQAPSSRTPPLSGMSGALPARPSGSEGERSRQGSGPRRVLPESPPPRPSPSGGEGLF